VIPADKKPFTRLAIAQAIVDAMDELALDFPRVQGKALKEIERVRGALMAEAPKGSKRANKGSEKRK